ncbi:MAG: hypothetical protein PHV93_02195 [Candidatus Pacebacteria bacterium]|nr:hypothetical protein [Candidatus Paceibacterota bacterium]
MSEKVPDLNEKKKVALDLQKAREERRSDKSRQEFEFLNIDSGKEPTEAEHLSAALISAELRLSEIFGVENLSNFEKIELRNFLKKFHSRNRRENELVKKREISRFDLISPDMEAVLEWLDKVCGIRVWDIPIEDVITDEADGKEYKFHLRFRGGDRSERDEKLREIESLGHKWRSDSRVPEDFIEYIRRKRDDAHHLQMD